VEARALFPSFYEKRPEKRRDLPFVNAACRAARAPIPVREMPILTLDFVSQFGPCTDPDDAAFKPSGLSCRLPAQDFRLRPQATVHRRVAAIAHRNPAHEGVVAQRFRQGHPYALGDRAIPLLNLDTNAVLARVLET
jgi:hypothetical protein